MFLMFRISVSIAAPVWFWDGKVKCRAAVHRAFRPCPAAVPMNDALDIGQADACALKLVVAVQALKHAEQFAGITRIETGAVVPNEDHRLLQSGNWAGRKQKRNSALCFSVKQPISILASARAPVNFTALEIRLTSTIRSKARSACTDGSGWIFHTIFRPFVSG